MTRLTKTIVDKIPIPPLTAKGKHAQSFVRDTTLPGFGLRITSGGTKTFIVETRINRRVKRITLGRYGVLTCEEARKEAQKLLGTIAKGGNPVHEKQHKDRHSVTLQIAFNDYLSTRKTLKSGTIQDYKRCIEGSLSNWLPKRITDIDKDMIEKRHSDLGKASPARANNTMRVLRAVFNHALEKYEDSSGNSILPLNPVNRLSRNRGWFRVNKKRSLIKPHQLKPWYEATCQLNREVTRDYLHFLLLTGLRRTEAATLTWPQVDLKDKTFTLLDTKNNQPHTLPLSDYLIELLERRLHQKINQWVFPSPLTDSYLKEPRTAVSRVSDLSGVEFRLHDLRRTFITIAESLDIPGYALKQLINHKNTSDVTAGYIVINAERLRVPMQQITDYILEKVNHG